MSPTELDSWAERVASAALALQDVPYGPWKGSMRSVSADQVVPDYATTGSDFLYQPRDGTWKRRDGQLIKFDSATGLLPAHWNVTPASSAGAKARHADEFTTDLFTDGLPTTACLFTREVVTSGLDDGRYSNFWIRDQVNGLNYTIGSEFNTTTTYPAPGTQQTYLYIPLWYQSGDGGITRGIAEFSRRFFFSGSRRWIKAGDWLYHPSRLGTPSRWRSSQLSVTSVTNAVPSTTIIGGDNSTDVWASSSLGNGGYPGDGVTNGTTPNISVDVDEGFPSDDISSFIRSNGNPSGTSHSRVILGLNQTLPSAAATYTITYRILLDNNISLSGHDADYLQFKLYRADGGGEASAQIVVQSVANQSTWATATTTITIGSSPSLSGTANSIEINHVAGAPAPRILISAVTVSGAGGAIATNANRLTPSGPFPPTHCGTVTTGASIDSEFIRPNADISNGGSWTLSTGATIFSLLDETTADDSDYVFVLGDAKEFTIGMADFVTDPTVLSGVNVVARARYNGLGAHGLKIELLETATVRATGTFTTTTSFANYTLTLTDTEVGTVTNWDNARIRITSIGAAVTTYVSQAYIERVPASATAQGGWRGKHQFMRAIAYRFEDGSVWMPSTPRAPNSLLTDGLGLTTVDETNPDQAYSFLRWQNLPIPPFGVTDLVLMRTEKIDSSTEDVLLINPFRMGVIAEVPAGTTTYDDYFPDDDSLTFDPSGLVIRYDHMMPPRSRYNFGGAQRVCHQNGSTNPCAITLAPVGLAADYDRNLADTSSTVYGSGSQFFYIENNAGTEALVLVKKTSGGTVSSQSLAFATYTKLQDLVDVINSTTFSGNGGQWRAQLCPDVSGDTPTALNLAAHRRVIASCVVSGQTITKATGGLSKVGVGAKVSGTGVTVGAYISRIDSDTQLTFVGTITPATISATFYFDTGDDPPLDGSLPWAQRVIANSLPGFAYFSMTWLNTEPTKKATTWMTTASPGSTKAAPNCFSALADNEHTPPIDAGIGMGGGAVGNGFVVAFSKKRGAIRNTRDSGTGVDSDYHLFITNDGSGCTGWNTIAQGDSVVFLMANEGVFACNLNEERLLSKRIHCHDPATGDFTFENPLGLLAAGGDTDGSYASARVVRGALWVCYRASGTTPNRVVVYPFTSGQQTTGLSHMVHADGEPFGWSVPLAYGTSPVVISSQPPRSSSEGLHIYGFSDGNAGSTGDGRADELETGSDDNSVAITASVELPWLRFSRDEQVSGQDMVIDHNSPSGSTGTMTFIRSFSATDTYSLTPTTSSLVVNSEPKFLPQAARVGANAVMLKWTQATGSARTLRRVLLRVKRLKFFKGA